MKSQCLAMTTIAIFVGSNSFGMALTPQPSEVCYDALGNTRYVPVGEPCKANEQKTKIIPQTSNPADDPQAQLQQQVTDLTAKVSALQSQVNQAQQKQNSSDPSQSGYVSHPGDSSAYNPKDVGRPGHDADPNWTLGFKRDGLAHNAVRAPFVVVDRNGVAIFVVTEDGSAGRAAQLVDATGNERVGMHIDPSGPQFTLFGNNLKSSVRLYSENNNGKEQFYNYASESVLALGSSVSSTGAIHIGDEKGREKVEISADLDHGEIVLRGTDKNVPVWAFSLLPHL